MLLAAMGLKPPAQSNSLLLALLAPASLLVEELVLLAFVFVPIAEHPCHSLERFHHLVA